MTIPEGQGKLPVQWRYSVWGVLVLLSTLGPFGLFFLWKSPVFSRISKGFWTIAILALTVFLAMTAELLPLWIAQKVGKF